MDELDEICGIPGIDIVFFGSHDFSHGIGRPGESGHPEVKEARKRVAETALKYGKYAGCVGSPAIMDELLELGFRFISHGADVYGLYQYAKPIADMFRKYQETY
jgi:4-hydroxy-2-oxoheptanedioate aldolase